MTHSEPMLRSARTIWLQILIGGMALFLSLVIAASINGALLPGRAFHAWLTNQEPPRLSAFFIWLNELGDRGLLGTFAAFLVLALPIKAQGRLWLLIAVLGASWELEELTETLVSHYAVATFGGGFPSAHVTAAAAFYVFGAYLLEHRLERRVAKIAMWLLAATFVLVVCFSRIATDIRWVLDTVGGVLLGLTCAAGAAWWSDVVHRARTTTHEGSAAPLLLYLLMYTEGWQLNYFADDKLITQLHAMCDAVCGLFDGLQKDPFAHLRNFPLQKGVPTKGPRTVYPRLQEAVKDLSPPKFSEINTFNYEASVA